VNEFHKIKGVYIVKEITKECENEWYSLKISKDLASIQREVKISLGPLIQ
jgi:hypothetical protein